MKYYKHELIILNIKSEGIEYKVLELVHKFNVTNYFFLDCSFPMINKLSKITNKIALRFSEFEGIDTIELMKNKIEWVWVDCFNIFPLTSELYLKIKNMKLKICIVSPELQGHNNDFIIDFNNFDIDAICTKKWNRK